MTKAQWSAFAVPLLALLATPMISSCKSETRSAEPAAAHASPTVSGTPRVEPVEPVVTAETPSTKEEAAAEGIGCEQAEAILATCAAEAACSTEMTMFLPSAARSQYVLLTEQAWFSEQQFDRYCERACTTKSPAVDYTSFKKDVCSADPAAGATAASTSVILLKVQGIPMAPEGVPVSKLTSALGKPHRVSESRYTCDSAFDAENVQEYVYPHATFESDGTTAVLRSMEVSESNQIVLPGLGAAGAQRESDIQKAQGIEVMPLKDHVYRTSTVPGGDLETAYDLIFRGGKLAKVEYWIGC